MEDINAQWDPIFIIRTQVFVKNESDRLETNDQRSKTKDQSATVPGCEGTPPRGTMNCLCLPADPCSALSACFTSGATWRDQRSNYSTHIDQGSNYIPPRDQRSPSHLNVDDMQSIRLVRSAGQSSDLERRRVTYHEIID